MTVRGFGELAAAIANGVAPTASGKVRIGETKVYRTFAPVRRNSWHVGEKEHTIWRPLGGGTKQGGRRFCGAYLRAAEKYDFDNKEPGKANGPLGHIGIQILRVMFRHADYKSGRIDPSIDTLMAWTRRSRAAICAALARLKAHGFVDWIRRTEPLENPDRWGPQVKQASNAYGVDIRKLPKMAKELLGRLLNRGAPAPDDATWTAEQDHQQTEAMHASVPLSETGSSRFPDAPAMAAALNGLGAAIEAAEIRSNASSPDGQNPEPEVLK